MGNLANRIKDVAKEHGISITEVANKLGVLQPAISRTINNPRITLEDLEKIAGVIGCKVSDFMEERKDTIICPHCGKKIVFTKMEEQGK
jgi:transcriptional regulator with XRE-family HTH domain